MINVSLLYQVSMFGLGVRALAQGLGHDKGPVQFAVKGAVPAHHRSAGRATPSATDCLPYLAATASLIQRLTGH